MHSPCSQFDTHSVDMPRREIKLVLLILAACRPGCCYLHSHYLAQPASEPDSQRASGQP